MIALQLNGNKEYPSDFPRTIPLSTTDAVLNQTLHELVMCAAKGKTPYYVFAIATLKNPHLSSHPFRYTFYDASCYRNQAHPDFKTNRDPQTHELIERIDYFALPLLFVSEPHVAIPYPPSFYYSDEVNKAKIDKYAFDAVNFYVNSPLRNSIQQNLYHYLFGKSQKSPDDQLELECGRWRETLSL